MYMYMIVKKTIILIRAGNTTTKHMTLIELTYPACSNTLFGLVLLIVNVSEFFSFLVNDHFVCVSVIFWQTSLRDTTLINSIIQDFVKSQILWARVVKI